MTSAWSENVALNERSVRYKCKFKWANCWGNWSLQVGYYTFRAFTYHENPQFDGKKNTWCRPSLLDNELLNDSSLEVWSKMEAMTLFTESSVTQKQILWIYAISFGIGFCQLVSKVSKDALQKLLLKRDPKDLCNLFSYSVFKPLEDFHDNNFQQWIQYHFLCSLPEKWFQSFLLSLFDKHPPSSTYYRDRWISRMLLTHLWKIYQQTFFRWVQWHLCQRALMHFEVEVAQAADDGICADTM